MGLLLFIERKRWIPSFDQFFNGAHINIPIVKEALQGGHMPFQKLTILADGIPAQGGLSLLAKGKKEFKCLLFSTPAVTGRGFDSIQETRFFVVGHAPLFHEQKYLIGLVYRYVWALSHKFQLIVGYHRGDLKDEVPFRVQTCHFQVYPDQSIGQDATPIMVLGNKATPPEMVSVEIYGKQSLVSKEKSRKGLLHYRSYCVQESILNREGGAVTLLGYMLIGFFQKDISPCSCSLLRFRSWKQPCHLNNLAYPVLPFNCHQVDSSNALYCSQFLYLFADNLYPLGRNISLSCPF